MIFENIKFSPTNSNHLKDNTVTLSEYKKLYFYGSKNSKGFFVLEGDKERRI